MVKPMKGHAETSLPLQAGGKAERQLGPYGYSGNHCWGRTNVLSLYPREEPRHQQLNPPPPITEKSQSSKCSWPQTPRGTGGPDGYADPKSERQTSLCTFCF